ncbi:peptide chain release factor N(5)-glutamine methyltransferase [Leptolyngbya sp. 'hensonii']|uniref:peptide chain release factor N(5)-glutamine methyltransferase n=1 Tax=Leptolyngbya sp. 'hensonii' TaxID=1922337 RepID=UPI000A6D1247|nr:peptide chain release factor N(5)-glutamine methyltransferase [Leptolyngbya sp. 'hensonii']
MVSGRDLWQWRAQALATAAAFQIPGMEVDWLLQSLSNLDRLSLRLESFRDWPQVELHISLAELEERWQQRVQQRVPVQYLAGRTSWRDFELRVSPAVLIPRPETEQIIDLAIAAAQESGVSDLTCGHWADLGTGSGAIALGLARAFPKAIIHAVDMSHAALAVAQANADLLGLGDRIRFYQGSWLDPLLPYQGQMSGLIANPPYIPSHLIPTLQPEVACHEPHLALDGGEDGLDCIRSLIQSGSIYLRSGGIWLTEMMAGQAEGVASLLHRQGSYCQIRVCSDLAGFERFALAYRC